MSIIDNNAQNTAGRPVHTGYPGGGAWTPGARRPQRTGNQGQEQREPAKIWLNIGLQMGEGENAKFVSLPMGVPLDGMQPFATHNIKDPDFLNFRKAQNRFLAQLQDLASRLAPGEDQVINVQLQVRHASEAAAPAMANDDDENPYAFDLVVGS